MGGWVGGWVGEWISIEKVSCWMGGWMRIYREVGGWVVYLLGHVRKGEEATVPTVHSPKEGGWVGGLLTS